MKKTGIIIILMLCLSCLFLLASCDKETTDNTEVTTEDQTLENQTTAEETTLTEEQKALMKPEKMKQINENTPDKLLPIGGWSTPASELRDGYSGVEGSYDEVYKLIADSGVNFMITLEEWSSEYWTLEGLHSAKQTGMKLYYNACGMSTDYTNERIAKILASEDADALGGIYVKDEPLLDEFDEVAELVSSSKAALGDKKVPVFANLLPNYAPKTSTGDYTEYVNSYVEKVKPDILMFDFYPPSSTKSANFKTMYSNLAVVKEAADKAGIDFWVFVQVTGNKNEMLCNAHANLAYGAKGMAYFIIADQYNSKTYKQIIDFKGNPTKEYDRVKEVNRQLLNMKGVYLDYDQVGFLDSGYKDITLSGVMLDSFAPVKSVEASAKTLVSCFEKEGGGKALYLVNTDLKNAVTVNVTFDGAKNTQLWGGEGLADISDGDSISFEIDGGAGCFLIIE